ncbi:LysR family transcriptional regulator [Klebsiella pneumoniae]|nr:LysR family transcriptional regulator [Klebsiella pneumoniae]
MAAAPYPAYNPKSPLAQGLLKLPVLAASTSLRRSRKAGAARMDAPYPAYRGLSQAHTS